MTSATTSGHDPTASTGAPPRPSPHRPGSPRAPLSSCTRTYFQPSWSRRRAVARARSTLGIVVPAQGSASESTRAHWRRTAIQGSREGVEHSGSCGPWTQVASDSTRAHWRRTEGGGGRKSSSVPPLRASLSRHTCRRPLSFLRRDIALEE